MRKTACTVAGRNQEPSPSEQKMQVQKKRRQVAGRDKVAGKGHLHAAGAAGRCAVAEAVNSMKIPVQQRQAAAGVVEEWWQELIRQAAVQ